MRLPPGLAAAVAPILVLACAPLQHARRPLSGETWRVSRAGTVAPFTGLGVWSDFTVDSTGEFIGANFDAGFDVSGELRGRLGAAAGVEWFAIDDLGLFAGVEYRLFDARLDPADTGVDPETGDPLLSFGTIDQLELFAGSRWYLPVRWGSQGRLRPYALAKIAYVPRIAFDAEIVQPLGQFDTVRLISPFAGGPYATLGLGGGLAWQVDEHLVWRFGAWYEWALSEPSDVSRAVRQNSSGNDFLDGVLDNLDIELSLDPAGPIAYTSLSWAF